MPEFAPANTTGIAEAALGALNMLKNLAEQMPENFAPNANLEALKPSPLLFTEVQFLDSILGLWRIPFVLTDMSPCSNDLCLKSSHYKGNRIGLASSTV